MTTKIMRGFRQIFYMALLRSVSSDKQLYSPGSVRFTHHSKNPISPLQHHRPRKSKGANVHIATTPAIATTDIVDASTESHKYRGEGKDSLNVTEKHSTSREEHGLLMPTAPHLYRIEQIAVVGERNAGTNFLFRMLAVNFANVSVVNHFCGWKHFLHSYNQCSPKEQTMLNRTLVVVLWKNVYDWLSSMHRNPYHMHMHFRDSFSEFIRRPMALVDSYNKSTQELLVNHFIEFNHHPLAHNLSTNPTDRLARYSNGEYCYDYIPDSSIRWQYDVFCPDSPGYLPEFNPPFYELNPDTNRPFANVIRMRSAKIKNFRNIQKWAPNVVKVRFEELIADGGRGSLSWIYELSDNWGLRPKLSDFELVTSNTKQGSEAFNASKYENNLYYSTCLRGLVDECCSKMSIEDATFIAEQVDRSLEAELEYVTPNVRLLCRGWSRPSEKKYYT